MADQVFMCYARQDEGFVLELAGALKAQGVPVWIDQWELPVGADWDMEIEEALSKSSHLVLVISPASMRSREVRDEWRWVLKRRKPIIPVLFQECELHRRLDNLHHIDFTSRSPTDATAVGEIVSALGMGQPAREEEARPPDLSAALSDGSRSALPVPAKSSTVFCEECGAPNDPDGVFCGNCGAPLPQPVRKPTVRFRCPICDAVVMGGDDVFCPECASEVAQSFVWTRGNICPACGAKNPPGSAFCAECAASLSSAPSA